VRLVFVGFSILLLALAPSRATAQGSTATLAGIVRDQQNLPVAGATVTVAGTESSISRTVATGADGAFDFPGLLPGEYLTKIELTGFETQQLQVRLEVNQRVRADVVLRAGGLAQQVEVVQTVPLLHVSDAVVGEVIDQRQVAELPLNGRQFLELAMLVPGTHSGHGAQMGDMSPLYWRPGQSSAISIAGARPNSNVYLLDGTVNTDPSFNTFVISLPPDSIREFQIQTGTYTAELGAGTSQINVVTRSGTFDFKGSLYEYVRNSRFDSPEFTSPDELPPFSQHQFGGTIGGPLGHRLFFFGGYEGLRTTQHMSNIMFVPGSAVRLGDFSGRAPVYDPLTNRANPAFNPALPITAANPQFIRTQFPDNQIPLDRINPIARQVLQQHVVQPNRDDPTDNYLDTRAQELRNDAFNLRLDRSWTNGTALFGRYSMSDENGFTPENLPGFGAHHDNRVQNLGVTLVNAASKRLLTETRFGFARMRLHRYGETANGADLVTQLGVTGVGYGGSDAFGLPRFDIQGYDPIGDSLLCTPCRYWNNNIQIGERVTWSLGAHSVRFGGDARRFVWDMLGFFQNRGYFQFTSPITSRTSLADGTGDPLASFLLGTPALAQRQAGTPSMNMRQTTYDAFIQDDWRITPTFTLNAGLRYELQTPLHDINKILTNLDFSNGPPVAFVGGQNGYPSGLVYTDKNNLAPRAGFAWALDDARSVIRAGAGVFYAYPDMNLWCNQVHNVPLVFPEIQTNNAATPAINTFGFAPPVLGRTLVGFTAIDTHLQIPRIDQASVSFERQVASDTMLQVGYLGAWGSSLDRSRLVNNAQPGPGGVQPRRPYQTVSFVPGSELGELPAGVTVQSLTFPVGPINLLASSGKSAYNSVWALVKRKFSRGLSLLASYTYADSKTDSPTFRSPANEAEVPQNSFDPGADWGPSGCDIRHRFVSSVIYKVPVSAGGGTSRAGKIAHAVLGGWQASLIYQWQSGFPFTISVFGDTANAGALLNVNPIRASVVPGVAPELPADQRSADLWFNTAAFATPAPFTFGTATRNSVWGPSLSKADLALDREIPIRAVQLHVRVEAFNVLNTVNYGTPNRFVNTPQFGTITEAATAARQIQFVFRAMF
jgi:outer membrane receptor protein involved in Fe transport